MSELGPEEKRERTPFARRLIELRAARRISQMDLAKGSGLSQSVIADYERGKAQPSLRNMLKIADAFGMDLADLLPTETKAELNNSKTRYEIHKLATDFIEAEARLVVGMMQNYIDNGANPRFTKKQVSFLFQMSTFLLDYPSDLSQAKELDDVLEDRLNLHAQLITFRRGPGGGPNPFSLPEDDLTEATEKTVD